MRATLLMLCLVGLSALTACPSEPGTDGDCPYGSCPEAIDLEANLDTLTEPQLDALCEWTATFLLDGVTTTTVEPEAGTTLEAVDCDGAVQPAPDVDVCTSSLSTQACSVDLHVACINSRGDACGDTDTAECQALQDCMDTTAPANNACYGYCQCPDSSWVTTPTSPVGGGLCVADDSSICANATCY